MLLDSDNELVSNKDLSSASHSPCSACSSLISADSTFCFNCGRVQINFKQIRSGTTANYDPLSPDKKPWRECPSPSQSKRMSKNKTQLRKHIRPLKPWQPVMQQSHKIKPRFKYEKNNNKSPNSLSGIENVVIIVDASSPSIDDLRNPNLEEISDITATIISNGELHENPTSTNYVNFFEAKKPICLYSLTWLNIQSLSDDKNNNTCPSMIISLLDMMLQTERNYCQSNRYLTVDLAIYQPPAGTAHNNIIHQIDSLSSMDDKSSCYNTESENGESQKSITTSNTLNIPIGCWHEDITKLFILNKNLWVDFANIDPESYYTVNHLQNLYEILSMRFSWYRRGRGGATTGWCPHHFQDQWTLIKTDSCHLSNAPPLAPAPHISTISCRPSSTVFDPEDPINASNYLGVTLLNNNNSNTFDTSDDDIAIHFDSTILSFCRRIPLYPPPPPPLLVSDHEEEEDVSFPSFIFTMIKISLSNLYPPTYPCNHSNDKKNPNPATTIDNDNNTDIYHSRTIHHPTTAVSTMADYENKLVQSITLNLTPISSLFSSTGNQDQTTSSAIFSHEKVLVFSTDAIQQLLQDDDGAHEEEEEEEADVEAIVMKTETDVNKAIKRGLPVLHKLSRSLSALLYWEYDSLTHKLYIRVHGVDNVKRQDSDESIDNNVSIGSDSEDNTDAANVYIHNPTTPIVAPPVAATTAAVGDASPPIDCQVQAIRIQSVWRSANDRRNANKLIKEIVIENEQEMNLLQKVINVEADLLKWDHDAAVQMQRLARGHLGRRQLKSVKNTYHCRNNNIQSNEPESLQDIRSNSTNSANNNGLTLRKIMRGSDILLTGAFSYFPVINASSATTNEGIIIINEYGEKIPPNQELTEKGCWSLDIVAIDELNGLSSSLNIQENKLRNYLKRVPLSSDSYDSVDVEDLSILNRTDFQTLLFVYITNNCLDLFLSRINNTMIIKLI